MTFSGHDDSTINIVLGLLLLYIISLIDALPVNYIYYYCSIADIIGAQIRLHIKCI